jgi:hypothetical protein
MEETKSCENSQFETEINVDVTSRKFIQRLRANAMGVGFREENDYWKRAYYNLAYSADALDALMARNEIEKTHPVILPTF